MPFPLQDASDASLRDTALGLARAIAANLPGPVAQQAMAVVPRTARRAGLRPEDMRQSAVLLLLYPHEGQLWLPLIRRSPGTEPHGGQIGLPGGGREPQDDTLWATALREAAEEVGILPSEVLQLGALTPLEVPVSNNLVHPFVGYAAGRPAFALQAREVASVLELPLTLLLDDSAKHVEHWELPGRLARVPFYLYGDAIIWGATAMILSELEALLRAL